VLGDATMGAIADSPARDLVFAILLFGVLLRAAGGGTNWVLSAHLLLDKLPDSVRGRVFATELAIFALCEAAGSLIGGAVTDAGVGYVEIMVFSALLALLPALQWSRWILARKRIDPALVGLPSVDPLGPDLYNRPHERID
jgi:hypothetical protein